MATTALDRVAQQLRAAQDASDKLNAFLAKRADAGHYIKTIATALTESLALAEASLMAARPPLNSHTITLGGDANGSSSDGAIWLDLRGVES